MIVGLVLKEYQPLLSYTVDFNRNYDGAGIDLIGHFHILELAVLTKLLHRNQSNIHQGYKLVAASLVKLFSGLKITLVAVLNRCTIITVLNRNVLQLGEEGRVTTVVRPISIQYADFGHGRVALFFVLKVITDVKEIVEGHRKT